MTDTFSLAVGESMTSRTGLEESTEEAELNLKPGELLRGVKDLQEGARDEVKLGIFSCEDDFLNLNGDRFLGFEEKEAIKGPPCTHLMAAQAPCLELKTRDYIAQFSGHRAELDSDGK